MNRAWRFPTNGVNGVVQVAPANTCSLVLIGTSADSRADEVTINPYDLSVCDISA
jgi:hypothetical protein